MEMKWTEQQQQVIRLDNRNLLVSAAAGSGKTAVLVERIIRKITDKNHPLDIDRLLIVTFTNAAAAQMRERIGAALGNALEREPDNVHLQRQQTLLHNAQITTIHSFCLYVIRNYFHRISMEPDFLMLSETIATGKTDQPLKDAILKLSSFAISYPWVEEWLEGCRQPFHIEDLDDFDGLPMAETLLDYLKNLTSQW